MEVQAAHTEYAATGSNEDYAAFALPDWRWGAIGVSLRHFGVDGIERRDDRNLLLEGDLSDSETEITLGFGRSLSDVLGIGGAVKLQRQSLPDSAEAASAPIWECSCVRPDSFVPHGPGSTT